MLEISSNFRLNKSELELLLMSMPKNTSPISRLGLLCTLASHDEITLKSKAWLSFLESVYFIWKYKEHIKRAPFISEGGTARWDGQ